MPTSNGHATTIDVAGETLLLCPEHAAYWETEATLFIADAHWGKAATFRAAAIPLPDTEVDHDLDRLSRLLDQTGAERLIILGDLLHHRDGQDERTWAAITSWRCSHDSVQIVLVEGNHDARAGRLPAEWGIERIAPGHSVGPFVLQHYPDPAENGYVLAGHLHPRARLLGAGGHGLTLPCFWFSDSVGVLPAFGSLCDGRAVKPKAGDDVFVVADDAVFCVSESSHQRPSVISSSDV